MSTCHRMFLTVFWNEFLRIQYNKKITIKIPTEKHDVSELYGLNSCGISQGESNYMFKVKHITDPTGTSITNISAEYLL